MSRDMRISACVIVKNEERDIVSWLVNASVYADELIVVDTGSSDKTRELAQQRGAKVFSIEWQDDFSQAKNYAMEQAGGDWLTFLDADETFLQPEQVRPYLQEIEKKTPKTNVLMVPIINVDEDNQDAEQSRFLNVRLFRNHIGLRYRNPVHETIYAAGSQELCMQEENNALHIRHTGYSTGRVHTKVMRNYRILQADIEAHGEQEHHYRYLADCYYGFGKLEQALHYALKAAKADLQAVGSASDMYDTAINCMELLDYSMTEQIALLTEAQTRFPRKLTYGIKIGHCLLQQKKWQEAQNVLENMKKFLDCDRERHGDEYTSAADKALLWQDLGLIYCRQHDFAAAAECLAQARIFLTIDEGILRLFMQIIDKEKISEQEKLLRKHMILTPEAGNYVYQWLERNGYWWQYKAFCGNGNDLYEMAYKEEIPALYKDLEDQAINDVPSLCQLLILREATADTLVKTKQILALKKLLPEPWEKIWDYWQTGKQITEEQYSDYKMLGKYVMTWGTVAQLDRYIDLSVNIRPEQHLDMANELLAQQKLDFAWQVYCTIPADSEAAGFDFWLHAGICQYQLDNHEVAAECFVKAREYDEENEELRAYQAWNERRLTDNA